MNEDEFICRKRFYKWVREAYPSYDPKDISKYGDYYREYLKLLDPFQMIQEFRVASNWKAMEIIKLVQYYKDEFNEDWPLPARY